MPAFASHSTLSILGLTETWIHPEDTATPAALSNHFSFSHTPHQSGRSGGTGLVISNNWKYSTLSSLCNNNSFEYHAITLTTPIKIHIVRIFLILQPSEWASDRQHTWHDSCLSLVLYLCFIYTTDHRS